MSGSYVEYGPFENGSPPGISDSFLNGVENFLLTINSAAYDANISSNGSGVQTTKGQIVNGAIQNNPTVVTLNGGTSGTAKLYQDCTGNVKRCLIILNNFRTAGSTQNLVLPVAFAVGANIITGEIGNSASVGGILLLLSGSAQTIRIVTAIASTGATYANATSNIMYQGLNGDCKTGFDTVQFPASGVQGANGFIVITGQ